MSKSAITCYMALLLITVAHVVVQASVIGIDYGTDWFKVSIVKTGVPLDIVLNVESKRKTPAIVHVKQGLRLFGSDAISKGVRFPSDAYPSLKNLMGKSFGAPIALDYRNTFTNQMLPLAHRGGICSFAENETSTFAVEELIGFQLAYAKHMAEKSGGEPVSGAVLTVPPNFNHFERRAFFDAAEIAGLRILNLMNDETAVALNYAMLRKFEEPQHHIFYDMGAGSTVASLVLFKNVADKKSTSKKETTTPQLQVKSVGSDDTLGGKAIDVRLQQILAAHFVKTTSKGKVTEEALAASSKSMAKLLREANRVKQILSANTETFASVESLYEEYDFKMKITRSELETACKDIFDRVTGPIQTVLAESGLKMDDISSVVLVGGGVRVPMIQQALKEFVGSDKLAQNVNGDEAAVLGAGFRAATLSKLFRVREILVKDKNYENVDISYTADDNTEVAATIFTNKVSLGAKKIMNFKKTTDFSFTVFYKASSVPIFNVSVTGVSEAFEKIKSKGTIKDAKVKASLSVSESGEFKVDDVFVQAEITKGVVGSITDSVLSFFGGKKKDVGANGEDGSDDGDASADGGNAAASADDQKVTSTATSTSTTSKTTNSDSIADDVNNVTDKVVNEKIRLDFKVDLLTVVPMTKADFDAIASRIADMDAADYKIKQRDEARNNLESFMYTVRDLMESTTAESVSTPESRQSLKEALDVVREFLDEDGDSAPIDDILVKDSLVRTIWEPIDLRRTEKLKRPDSIAILQKALLEAKQLMSEVTTKNEALIQEISVAQEKWEKYLEEERVKDEEEASSVAAAAASSSSADSAEGHDSSSTSIDDKEKETPVSDEENSSSSSSASITPTSATITSTRSRLPSPKPTPTFGREDLEQVSQLVNSSDEWLTKKIQEQDAIADTESPVLLSQDINAKNAAVAKEMNRISEMSKRFFKMSSKPKKDKAKKPLKASSAEKKAKEDARKEDEAAAAAADKEDQAAGSGGGGTTHDEL